MTKVFQFKGKLIKVTTKTKILPNGRKAVLDVVEHPGAVLIVPFLEDDRIVMIHQYRPVLEEYLYELPAGTINPGESLLACASRELIEETGFRAGRLTRKGVIVAVPGYSTEVITIFKAQKLTVFDPEFSSLQLNSSSGRKQGDKDPDEVIRVCLFRQTQIRSLFSRGRIKDAKTICALTFCGVLYPNAAGLRK